jgi:hypothetical protein
VTAPAGPPERGPLVHWAAGYRRLRPIGDVDATEG